MKLEQLRPMKAVTGTLPVDEEGWAFEIKWDGMRILTIIRPDQLTLLSGNGIDATGRYPELASLAGALAGHTVVLDGEVVAFDDKGRPSFGRLQHRMHVGSAAEVRRRAEEVPISYIVFDLLHLDGHDVTPLPYTERRRLLADLVPDDGYWTCPAAPTGGRGPVIARRREGAGPRGRDGEATRQPVPPGQAFARVAEGKGAAAAGVRDRRLAAGRGQP